MTYSNEKVRLFVIESNLIEQITRDPLLSEIEAVERVLSLHQITTAELCRYQWAICPGQPLRVDQSMNVQVGSYVAPPGGPNIRARLDRIVERANAGAHPFEIHIRFELLHPFMDDNGRTGRMLWLWQMRDQDLQKSFLHQFYYQTLEFWRTRASST